MAGKLGEHRLSEAIDRGFRELGGFFFPESNIAQPMYPSRTVGESPKAEPSADPAEGRSVLDERIERAGREDPGKDDRGRDGPDMDR
jgi:hypothetical protein